MRGIASASTGRRSDGLCCLWSSISKPSGRCLVIVGRHTWTFLQFAILLLETILLYLLAALALPNAFSAEIVDLRANYFRHARWFFGSFLAVLLVSLVKNVVMSGSCRDLSIWLFIYFGSQEPPSQPRRAATCFTKRSFASPAFRS